MVPEPLDELASIESDFRVRLKKSILDPIFQTPNLRYGLENKLSLNPTLSCLFCTTFFTKD